MLISTHQTETPRQLHAVLHKAKEKVSGFKLYIGQLHNQCSYTLVLFLAIFLFLPTTEIRDTCIHGYWNQTKFPIHKSMVAKRGHTNLANVHTPIWKKSFKTQHGRIPIDPVILAAIGHRFIAPLKPETGD